MGLWFVGSLVPEVFHVLFDVICVAAQGGLALCGQYVIAALVINFLVGKMPLLAK